MSYKYQRNASCSCQDHVTIGSVQYVVADVMTFTPDKVPCGDNMDDLVMYYQDLHQLLDPELLHVTYAYFDTVVLQQKLQDIVVLRAPPKMIGSEEERKRRAEDGFHRMRSRQGGVQKPGWLVD